MLQPGKMQSNAKNYKCQLNQAEVSEIQIHGNVQVYEANVKV